jgi:ribosomal subunit interface protein
MQLPVQVTFRELSPSPSIDQHVRRRAAKLDTFYDRIMSCRVVVEVPHRHHRHGQRYHVRIDMTVPGKELVVGRTPPLSLSHEDVNAAIDAAFDDAERMVEEHSRRLRDERRTAAR